MKKVKMKKVKLKKVKMNKGSSNIKKASNHKISHLFFIYYFFQLSIAAGNQCWINHCWELVLVSYALYLTDKHHILCQYNI